MRWVARGQNKVFFEKCLNCRPLQRVAVEHRKNNHFKSRVFEVPSGKGRNRAFGDRLNKSHNIQPIERALEGAQLVEDNTQRPHVALRRPRLARADLWGNVERSPNKGVRRRTRPTDATIIAVVGRRVGAAASR